MKSSGPTPSAGLFAQTKDRPVVVARFIGSIGFAGRS